MNAKKGARTIAIAGVMDSPFALAASAALLSVPCMQEIALRQLGKAVWMQYVRAYCAQKFPCCNMFLHVRPHPFPEGRRFVKVDFELKPMARPMWEEDTTTNASDHGGSHCVCCGCQLDVDWRRHR